MPIDYSLPIEEIQRLVAEVDVSAIFTDTELLSEFDPELIANYPILVNYNTCEYALSLGQLQTFRTCNIYDNDLDIALIIFPPALPHK